MACRRSATALIVAALLTGLPLQALGKTDNSTTGVHSLRGSGGPLRFELRWAGQANTCMDVAGGRDEDFTKIQVWACEYPENQRFYFVPSYGGLGQIRWAKDTGKCLDVKDGNTNNFADVVLYSCHSSGNPDFDHQLFAMDAWAPGLQNIRWKSKCLDLKDGIVGSPSQPNSKVITYDCHWPQDRDWIHQQWKVQY